VENRKPSSLISLFFSVLAGLVFFSAGQGGGGCGDKINIGDGGLISAEPCAAPCFLGITPDESSYQDVINILSVNAYLDSCEEFDKTSEAGNIGIKCEDAFIITFDANKELVTGLGFNLSMQLSVEDVIARYGEPESVAVSTGGYAEITSEMRLFFPDVRMSLILEQIKGSSYRVKPTTRVVAVSYEGVTSYQELTDTAQTWSSYGEYYMKFSALLIYDKMKG
jgi:hypothetical protein